MSSFNSGLFDLPDMFHFAKNEENTLKYWEEIDAFRTSLKQSEGKPRYILTFIIPFLFNITLFNCSY